jgi:hypothetical protein
LLILRRTILENVKIMLHSHIHEVGVEILMLVVQKVVIQLPIEHEADDVLFESLQHESHE